MATDGAGGDGNKKGAQVVQLVGIILTFIAACGAAVVSYIGVEASSRVARENAARSEQIQTRLQDLQQAQSNADLAFRAAQANRDTDRQYLALVYPDLMSNNLPKQRMAISLVSFVEPNIGIRLLNWARESNIILPDNQPEARAVETALVEDTTRFVVYVHLGRSGNRPVPDRERVIAAIGNERLRLGGVDALSDTSGPRVDYFFARDEAVARRVAAAMQALLPAGTTVRVNLQVIPNRVGTLGVWF